ncbi:MAG: hypothetical protein GF398_00055 [Chitinivibrionales bacterium]|nr:hypothetical protein [Chitinivibrionales bacterium]
MKPPAASDIAYLAQKFSLFGRLTDASQQFLHALYLRYQFSFQQFRLLVEYGRDLEMWNEASFEHHWRECERRTADVNDVRVRKDKAFAELRNRLQRIKAAPTNYTQQSIRTPRRMPLEYIDESSGRTIFGYCPVASEKTVCCNLRTLDAVQNCRYACSYCTIQTFYGNNVIFDKDLPHKLQQLESELESGRYYRIGTGQSSDALAWGNRNGMLDQLCAFARRNRQILLEFKTKSGFFRWFEENDAPPNVVCSWTLNPDIIIAAEEHATAQLDQRITAARKVADTGTKIAFHFHPLVYYEEWEAAYPELAQRIIDTFDPAEVLFVSFGSVTFIKPVIKAIRKRGEPTRILQMDMVPGPHGKLTYPDEIKVRMFKKMYATFEPWHSNVFFYLCMERDYFWHQTFGHCYPSNEAFERDFGKQVMAKINRSSQPARSQR